MQSIKRRVKFNRDRRKQVEGIAHSYVMCFITIFKFYDHVFMMVSSAKGITIIETSSHFFSAFIIINSLAFPLDEFKVNVHNCIAYMRRPFCGQSKNIYVYEHLKLCWCEEKELLNQCNWWIEMFIIMIRRSVRDIVLML